MGRVTCKLSSPYIRGISQTDKRRAWESRNSATKFNTKVNTSRTSSTEKDSSRAKTITMKDGSKMEGLREAASKEIASSSI